MSLKLLFAGLIFFSYPLYAMDIHGAGATFPALLYQKWAESYTLHKGIEVQYLAVGSGEGIKRIDEKVVDFGGSDMPLTADELSKKGLFQFPMVMGAITPVFNIPGVYIAQLKLDASTLANIFLGKIKKWNDPVLLALNPSKHMPDIPIIVIHREDKSGTTFNFTNYLSKVSEDWRQKVGEGLAVNWPTGEAAKGNAGVANKVKDTSGAIGYVDYADAMEKHLNYPLLKNHDGFFVRPNAGSTEAAAAGAPWDAENGFYQVLTNAPGETSWPIAATTFILLRKDSNDVEYTQNVLKFIDWNFRTGELPAMYFDFVMPPKQVVEMIRTSWRAVKDHTGKSVWN